MRDGCLKVPKMVDAAFKEWSSVVQALGGGHQILIFRKGGLDEGPHGFEVRHDRFWLFPTHFHQQSELIVHQSFNKFNNCDPADLEGKTPPIKWLCQVTDHHVLMHPGQIKAIRGQHIWKEEVLLERMAYGSQRKLHALIVRVYQLDIAFQLPMNDAYAGCRSWIQLEGAPNAKSAKPVLNEEAFEGRKQAFIEALA